MHPDSPCPVLDTQGHLLGYLILCLFYYQQDEKSPLALPQDSMDRLCLAPPLFPRACRSGGGGGELCQGVEKEDSLVRGDGGEA